MEAEAYVKGQLRIKESNTIAADCTWLARIIKSKNRK